MDGSWTWLLPGNQGVLSLGPPIVFEVTFAKRETHLDLAVATISSQDEQRLGEERSAMSWIDPERS